MSALTHSESGRDGAVLSICRDRQNIHTCNTGYIETGMMSSALTYKYITDVIPNT